MNSGVLKPDTLRLSSRVYPPQDLGDADAIELRALGGVFRKRWKLLFGAATISARLCAHPCSKSFFFASTTMTNGASSTVFPSSDLVEII